MSTIYVVKGITTLPVGTIYVGGIILVAPRVKSSFLRNKAVVLVFAFKQVVQLLVLGQRVLWNIGRVECALAKDEAVVLGAREELGESAGGREEDEVCAVVWTDGADTF